MTPEEQARRLVEEWLDSVGWRGDHKRWPMMLDLVRRLVPVFAQAHSRVATAADIGNDAIERIRGLEAKLERAEVAVARLRDRAQRVVTVAARAQEELNTLWAQTGWPPITAEFWDTIALLAGNLAGQESAATEPGRPTEEKG